MGAIENRFKGMELEGGMPSYEAVKEMDDATYAKYYRDFLDPSRDANKTKLMELKKIKNQKKQKQPIDIKDTLLRSLQTGLQFPIRDNMQRSIDTLRSIRKIKKQAGKYGTGSVVKDSGLGIASGLADGMGSILDLGGLVPNSASKTAHQSAQWWKNRQSIPQSEPGSVGKSIGNDLFGGVIGGAAGRGIGTIYRGMRRDGEVLRHSATKSANNRQKLADDHIDYGHKFLTKIGMPSNIRKGKISYEGASMVRQNVYENLTDKLPHKPLNSGESLGSILSHNIKRNFDKRAMLQANDKQINNLFNQGHSLKQAKRIQRKQWNSMPQDATITGMLGGMITSDKSDGLGSMEDINSSTRF